MIRKLFAAGYCATALLLGAGCTNMTMLRTQELRTVQAKVDSLRTDLMTLQTKMYEEQKTQSEIIRLMRADQQLRFGVSDNLDPFLS